MLKEMYGEQYGEYAYWSQGIKVKEGKARSSY